ncbi:transcription termination/antitermination NusG family protein [Sediminimonas sp.]|uniref:transcription termination/antitermination protein NusG n=1 Tax=Sediminimonas sp. TaxID=2823379 RepID=UPI0025CEE564|nr:transcription termination/antitermination NusG family protein [Sediminimonas sp.]
MISLRSSQLELINWHLLLCKPNQNHIALRHLSRIGVDVFMPQHMVERRWRGRFKPERQPVFAGYIFFGVSPNGAHWQKIRTLPGVSQLIGFGSSGLAQVPGDLVSELMQRCDTSGLLQPHEDFEVGDDIRITKGPFRDFASKIERIDAEKRIHVLLDLLGQKTRVTLDPAQVRRRA